MMVTARLILGILVICFGSSVARTAECEAAIGRHMIAQALLAAQFVALAEKSGMTSGEINAILKKISEKSAGQEFWITDSTGHAYLTNTGIDFSFTPDSAKQPQASEFWPLIKNNKETVIQPARKREIDNQIFKYVGVPGVDKPRIVQVGVAAANMCK